jgi:hypothetical protein
MTDTRAKVGELLNAIRPIITSASTYKWEGDDQQQYWEFLRRAALLRQLEAMDAICAMSDAGHGHFGVTFLRPAFEELVWIEFLSKNVEVAKVLVPELSRNEAATSIKVQIEFGGIESLKALGFNGLTVMRLLAINPEVRSRIKSSLLTLGWKNDRNLLPSMKFLTKKVGRAKEYDYIYHGTSRFVHFSTQELLRRVWGKHGEVNISSKSFSQFWSNFALYWGFYTFLFLLIACHDLLPDDDSEDGKDLGVYKERFTELIRALDRVPIITMEELRSWSVNDTNNAPPSEPGSTPPSSLKD